MSRESIEIVRRCYGFWPDRDFSTISELVDPDVVLDLSRNVLNPGVHHGLDGFRRFLEEIDETWEDFQIHSRRVCRCRKQRLRCLSDIGEGAWQRSRG
jgi:ketosteroid isomerase-like protein